MQKPSTGQIVHFKPQAYLRDEWSKYGASIDEGQLLPAVIVRVWDNTCVNLRVLLDGDATPWVTSSMMGEGCYEWRWPSLKGGSDA